MPCIDFPAFDLMSNIMQVGEKTGDAANLLI